VDNVHNMISITH